MKISLFIIFSLFILFPFLNSSFLPISKPEESCPVIDFFEGFLLTSNLLSEIPDLSNCKSNITYFPSNINEIITLFESKNLTNIVKAINLAGLTASNLVLTCGNTYIEAKKLKKQLEQDFSNETFIFYGISRLTNKISDVLEYIDNSVFDFENGDYLLSGEDLGKIAKIFLFEQEEKILLKNQMINSLKENIIKCDDSFFNEKINIKNIFTSKNGNFLNIHVIGMVSEEIYVKNSKIIVKGDLVKKTKNEGKNTIFHSNELWNTYFQIEIPEKIKHAQYLIEIIISDRKNQKIACSKFNYEF